MQNTANSLKKRNQSDFSSSSSSKKPPKIQKKSHLDSKNTTNINKLCDTYFKDDNSSAYQSEAQDTSDPFFMLCCQQLEENYEKKQEATTPSLSASQQETTQKNILQFEQLSLPPATPLPPPPRIAQFPDSLAFASVPAPQLSKEALEELIAKEDIICDPLNELKYVLHGHSTK